MFTKCRACHALWTSSDAKRTKLTSFLQSKSRKPSERGCKNNENKTNRNTKKHRKMRLFHELRGRCDLGSDHGIAKVSRLPRTLRSQSSCKTKNSQTVSTKRPHRNNSINKVYNCLRKISKTSKPSRRERRPFFTHPGH